MYDFQGRKPRDLTLSSPPGGSGRIPLSPVRCSEGFGLACGKCMAALQLDASVICVGVWILHVARSGAGDGCPEVLLNDLERHVDSRGNACGGKHAPILHEVSVVLDMYLTEGVTHRSRKRQ